MSQSKKISTYVALLRGVNVGGKNKVPMKVLAQMFVEAACADVRTYIQSGNVVFRAAEVKTEKLPDVIAKGIAEVFGFRVPVVVRSVAEMAGVIENNPFLKAGASEETLYVLFLSTKPEAEQIAALDPDRSPPDRFVVHDREIYMQLPNGVADSKLTNAYFDSKLATMCTGRNWRTVLKLYEMMQG
jgi:uncharacterized protein (DUF1697 family)